RDLPGRESKSPAQDAMLRGTGQEPCKLGPWPAWLPASIVAGIVEGLDRDQGENGRGRRRVGDEPHGTVAQRNVDPARVEAKERALSNDPVRAAGADVDVRLVDR